MKITESFLNNNKPLNIFSFNKIYEDKKNFIDMLYGFSENDILLDNSHDPNLSITNDIDFYTQIDKICKDNKNKIFVMSLDTQTNNQLDTFEFISFPLAHLFGTYFTLGIDKLKNNYKKINTNYTHDQKYFLKCLNNNFNNPRAMMVDLLHKNNLLDNKKTLYSWNMTDKSRVREYDFKYFDGNPHCIEDMNKWSTQYLSPNLERNSILHIVGETEGLINSFTEKTFKPIWNGEFFILYGVPGQNKLLETYGFNLFNDIIDYDFDLFSNEMNGIENLVHQIKKLEQKNYNDIIEETHYKVKHNFQVALSIVRKRMYTPTILKTTNIKIHSISYNLKHIFEHYEYITS